MADADQYGGARPMGCNVLRLHNADGERADVMTVMTVTGLRLVLIEAAEDLTLDSRRYVLSMKAKKKTRREMPTQICHTIAPWAHHCARWWLRASGRINVAGRPAASGALRSNGANLRSRSRGQTAARTRCLSRNRQHCRLARTSTEMALLRRDPDGRPPARARRLVGSQSLLASAGVGGYALVRGRGRRRFHRIESAFSPPFSPRFLVAKRQNPKTERAEGVFAGVGNRSPPPPSPSPLPRPRGLVREARSARFGPLTSGTPGSEIVFRSHWRQA
ncbi:hypothetical protein GQ53DRAFT_136923 [Thozetella sp. PMI_491]|nr:hypothetical protein GQ53DRAFT_136923 [Thozetella sp. PMI_491]